MLRSVFALAGALFVAAVGSAQSYANNATTINAGVVVLDNDYPQNGINPTPYAYSAAPFAFYNLDSATKIKPAGWSFQNPFAPSAVSQAILTEWTNIGTEQNVIFPLPALGEKVTKRDAAYWSVFLDNMSDADLSRYQILLVAPKSYLSLTPVEREHLRRFVDGGGVLWVDAGALNNSTGVTTVIDEMNNVPAAFSISALGSIGPSINADFTQPILSSPYPLTASDIAVLDGNSTTYLVPANPGDYGSAAGNIYAMFGSTISDYYSLQAYSNNGKNINTGMYTRIGDGFVVVTARGASLELNRSANVAKYSTNIQYFALDNGVPPALGPDGIAAAKLTINMISLTSEARQAQSGSRKSNSTAMDVSPPLLQRYNLENAGLPPPTAGNPTAVPVFYKNMVFMTAGNNLYAYDVYPPDDLDGDGNTDDGILDYSVGAPYDLVWEATVGGAGALSSPACGEAANFTGAASRDQVWVLDNNGALHGYNAMPTVNGMYSSVPQATLLNEPPIATLSPPGGAATFSANSLPPAPTIQDGYIYVADTQTSGLGGSYIGRVWIAEMRTASYLVTQSTGNQWVIGGAASAASPGTMGDISGSPIVGQIPIFDNSGGGDKVLYVPNRAQASSTTSCGFTSIWLGARGEVPPQPSTVAGGALQVTTRASEHGGLATYTDATIEAGSGGNSFPDPRTIKLTILDANNKPWAANVMAQFFDGAPTDNGAGVLSFPFATGQDVVFQNLLAQNLVSIRVDYTIDWGKFDGATMAKGTSSIVRGNLAFPDYSPQARQVVGNLAMSPRGTIYAVVSDPDGSTGGEVGGSFYAVREQGFGAFNVVERYSLYPAHTMVLNQAGPVSYDEVLFDKDPINRFVETGQNWPNSNDRRMKNIVFTSGPTVRNGEVFVAASATKTLNVNGVRIPNVPMSILMAFNAEPAAPEILVGQWPNGSQIVQPDFDRSLPTSLTNPSAETQLQFGQNHYNYDADSGSIVFNSLADGTAGSILNCLSLSQPVILRRPGTPDTLIDPSSQGNRWSPLLWYQVFQGATQSYGATPVVTGDSVMISMGSSVPNILTSNGASFNPVGVVNATIAQIPANDPWLQSIDYEFGSQGSYRSWQNQLWTLPTPFPQGPGATAPTTGADPYLIWPQMSGVQALSDYVTRLDQTTMGSSPNAYALASGNGAVAALGPKGLYLFDRAEFLVCDDGRMSRFDSSGNPIQQLQGFNNSGAGGVSNAANYKPLIRPTKAYDLDGHSALVVDKGGNRVVKVDTGGNELRSIENFQFDPNYGNPTNQAVYANIWPREGGFINESRSLKSPSDVYTYSEYVTLPGGVQANQEVTNQQPLEYWKHYVIADQGNNRLIELVDRFQADPTTYNVGPPVVLSQNVVKSDGTLDTANVPQVGVCLWHSPAGQSGKGFAYNSVSRVWIPAYTASGSATTVAGRFVYVAGIGNSTTTNPTSSPDVTNPAAVSPNSSIAGNAQGGIVVFDPLAPNFAQVFNGMYGFQNMTNTQFWDFATSNWDLKTPLNVSNATSTGQPVVKPFTNVSSVTSKVFATVNGGVVTNPQIQIMVATSDGVYEVDYNAAMADQTQVAAGALPINWYLPSQVYCSIRNTGTTAPILNYNASAPNGSYNPMALHATYAKRLDNGEVLIVNGYSGTFYPNFQGAFTGEVIEVDGNTESNPGFGFNLNNPNLGFGIQSIHFELGPIQKVRGLRSPSFADRR